MNFLSISERILTLTCGLGVVQGILLAGLIYFRPKGDRAVNLFLALFICNVSVVMTLPFIMRITGWQHSAFAQPIPLLSGPFLYLYIRSFKERITWKMAWPHFILFASFFFFASWNMSYWSERFPEAKTVPPEALHSPITIFFQFVKAAQQIIYFLLARKTLLSYQRSIVHLFSETSRINLEWTKFLMNGYLILILVFVVVFSLIISFPQYFETLLLINMAIGAPYIYISTYKGLMQRTAWQLQTGLSPQVVEKEFQEVTVIDTKEVSPKTLEDPSNREKFNGIIHRITTLMEKEKLYQETELTLHQLATKLEVPTYQVSQALNEGMSKNFYDLVNGYRVEEAKRLLLDERNRNYTILSVGFEAGFNSKTTFNTVFKKFTGLTPTAFREQSQPVMATA